MLKNFSLKKKLFALVAASLALFFAASFISLVCTSQIQAVNQQLGNLWLPSITDAQDIKGHVADLRALELRYILAEDAEKSQLEQSMQTMLSEIEEHFASYGSIALNEEGKKLYDNLLSYWNTYAETHKTVLQYAKSGKEAQAAELLKTTGQEQYDALTTEADSIVEFNETGVAGIVDTVSKNYIATFVSTVLGVIVCATITIPFAIAITRSITRPLQELETAMQGISHGKLDYEITYKGEDEIGRLAHSVRHTMQRLNTMLTDLAYLMGELADGNFDCHTKCEDAYVGQYRPLLADLRKTRLQLSETMAKINTSSDQVSAGADQVAGGSQAYSQGATEQASSVQQLAAMVSDISGQITQNAKSAETASSQANEVGESITMSNEKMKHLLEAMNDIDRSSAEIGKNHQDH